MDHARLLSLAAHELRTPVSVVGGYLRMLQRDPDSTLTDTQRKLIEDAQRSCARISELVDELSELSRLEIQAATGRHESLDLFPLLREAADVVNARGDDQPAIAVDVPDGRVAIDGNRGRLLTSMAAIFRALARERPTVDKIVARAQMPDMVNRADAQAVVIVIGSEDEINGALDAGREPVDLGRGGMGLALPIAERVLARYGWTLSAVPSATAPTGRGTVIVSVPLGSPRLGLP